MDTVEFVSEKVEQIKISKDDLKFRTLKGRFIQVAISAPRQDYEVVLNTSNTQKDGFEKLTNSARLVDIIKENTL